MSDINIDLMEYSSDALAQAAYVSSDATAPVAYTHFKLNEDAASTAVDDTGSGDNDGTSVGNTSAYSVVGKILDAFEFNGTNETVTADAIATNTQSDTTGSVSWWQKTSDINDVIWAWGDADGNAYMQANQNANKLNVILRETGGQQFNFLVNHDVNDGEWWHFVVVQNGTQVVIYTNGALETDITRSVTTDEGAWLADAVFDRFNLAARDYNSGGDASFWAGTIDDWRYYKNTALTLAQVQEIYNSGNGTESELAINLQSYSESTIKTQGSYSLKGVAVTTDSLNDTLTKTL